jgi:hypothetical protein
MARRNNNKMTRSRKVEPSVMTMTFSTAVSPADTPGRSVIDISQVASLANRRFYRQGLNWAVAGIKIISAIPGQCWTYKLPNTWVMSNAWHKSFATWQRMNKEALAESESIRPKFLDFKIYMDSNHHAAGFAANLLPLANDLQNPPVSVATAGEWDSSKVIIPDNTNPGFSTEREFVAVGANYPGLGASGLNAVSLIEGYAASRGLPDVLDPNAPDDAALASGPTPENWMVATFNEGTSQDQTVIEDMLLDNRIAPYPFENDGANVDTMYPGGANQLVGLQNHDITNIYSTSGTTTTGVGRIKGGNFPCGLIAIDWVPTGQASNLVVQVDLVPGHHRGYLAESMQDM